MATHSSVLAWRIPGTGEPGELLSMGSHRVGHDWSDLAAAAFIYKFLFICLSFISQIPHFQNHLYWYLFLQPFSVKLFLTFMIIFFYILFSIHRCHYLLNDFFLICCIKIYPLCSKFIWILTNAWQHMSMITVSHGIVCCPQISSVLYLFKIPHHKPLATIDVFIVPIVFFPKMSHNWVAIMQYENF